MVKKRSYATAAGNKDDDELHDDNDNGDQLHRCSGCPKTFSTSKGLNNHLSQSHTCKHAIINALIEKQSMYLGSTVTGKSTVEGTLVDNENARKDPPSSHQNSNQQQAMSFQEDIHTFEDEDEADDEAYNENHPEVEVEFDFEEENDSQDFDDHVSIDDPAAADTDIGVVLDVPHDPTIIPDNLSYEEIGIITDDMLDTVVPHSTSDLIHSKLIDLLSQFNAPRYELKKS